MEKPQLLKVLSGCGGCGEISHVTRVFHPTEYALYGVCNGVCNGACNGAHGAVYQTTGSAAGHLNELDASARVRIVHFNQVKRIILIKLIPIVIFHGHKVTKLHM